MSSVTFAFFLPSCSLYFHNFLPSSSSFIFHFFITCSYLVISHVAKFEFLVIFFELVAHMCLRFRFRSIFFHITFGRRSNYALLDFVVSFLCSLLFFLCYTHSVSVFLWSLSRVIFGLASLFVGVIYFSLASFTFALCILSSFQAFVTRKLHQWSFFKHNFHNKC